MSSTPSTEAPEKKSKFKFKNGLKNLRRSVSKNDTVQHFTGTPIQNKTAANPKSSNSASDPSDANNSNPPNPPHQKSSSKSLLRRKSKSKTQIPVLPRYKLSEYEFPQSIVIPSESWGRQQYDSEDHIIHQYLEDKYKSVIAKLSFFPTDILLRFTVSQRGMKPLNARRDETELNFQKYLKYHQQNHYDNVLTNQTTNPRKSMSHIQTNNHNALPLFIYGQDKEGHPILWDDGSAYSKDAKLDPFKNDMSRVDVFRARLMRRMHNIKLHASKTYGRMIYKHCLVMDLERFNAKQFVKDRKFHEQNTKQTSDLFPEVLHRLYIINTPWAFRSAWKVIQTFLHPITVQKTKILGKDYINELVKDIDVGMIPSKFGGRGPWEIVYSDAPFQYPLNTEDIKFDYNELPDNKEAAPPRAAVPDMNKHKAKQMKQMKMNEFENGMEEDDELELGVNDDGDQKEMEAMEEMVAAKSAPTPKNETKN